ncbi:NUDIX domain-containing protein [Streptomyces sp. CC224B]|uniref:NUDIX domain-containing protein n=1 Tax=Streptomyces sp. CC224B TaxID=3044571 RepID=UPI0024A847D7|nr:NUDIX domain-containing protein [Streptomyces sp. CC224B]
MHKDVNPAAPPLRRIGAVGIIRDYDGRVLLVDPAYKDGWILPGGGAHANEFPHVAVTREVQEEVGLELYPARLLVVDYVPENEADDVREGLTFVFDMGSVGADTPKLINSHELTGVQWVLRDDLPEVTVPAQERRIREALRVVEGTGTVHYLVNGERVCVNGSRRPIT